MVEVDFPDKWPNLVELVLAALNQAQKMEEIYGALLVLKSLVKTFQRSLEYERAPLEFIMERLFPYLQNLMMKHINQWTNESGKICEIILSTFCMAIWMQLPKYFTADKLKIWMVLVKVMLKRPLSEGLTNKLAQWDDMVSRSLESEWKIKSHCMKIASR